jgi:hypothetical protein
VHDSTLLGDEVQTISRALEQAQQQLGAASIHIAPPFSIAFTNGLEDSQIHFWKTDKLGVLSEVALISVPHGRDPKIRTQVNAAGGTLTMGGVALHKGVEASMRLLRREQGSFSAQEFYVDVWTNSNGRGMWHFVYSFPPYYLHSRKAVIIQTNGEPKVVARSL